MVSLEERSSYRSKLIQKPIVKAFVEFIDGKNLSPGSFSALNVTLYKCMVAFQANDKATFVNEYDELSRRKPTASAPFVYNDFLLYLLICGTRKFNLSQSWIQEILDFRNCSDEECELITLTLKNLLSSNYVSKNNHFPTILVFQYLCETPLFENSELNATYGEIVQNPFPRYSSDFLNLLILRAYDIIVLRKDVLETGKISHLKAFDRRFNLRVKLVSKILHWLFVIVLYAFVIYTYFDNISFQELIKPHLGFFNAIGGGGLLVMFFFKENITKFYGRIIKRFWGYKNKTE
jgi:hypothetical protein